MKKTASIILIIAILMGMAMPASAAQEEPSVQPRYLYILSFDATIEVSHWYVAACSARLSVNGDYSTEIVMKLQQQDGSSWTTLKTWTLTDVTGTSDTKYYAVSSSGTYRLQVLYYVYGSNGAILESATKTVYP